MATPRQHVVHADRNDRDIDQNAKSHATVTESADERWKRKKESVKKGFLLTSVVGFATYFQFKSSFALAAKKGDGSAISPLDEFKQRMHEIFPQAKKSPSSGDESENIETVEDFIKYITEDRKKKSAPTNSDSENT